MHSTCAAPGAPALPNGTAAIRASGLRTLAATLLAIAAVAALPHQSAAQRTAGLAGGVRPEVRADVRWAGAPDGQVTIGGSIPVDRAVRVALLAGAGVERSAGGSASSVMAELHARLLLDPFGARRFGWYGAVGLGFRGAEGTSPRGYLLGLVGVEGPRMLDGRLRMALEAGAGDGMRAGLVVRAARGAAR